MKRTSLFLTERQLERLGRLASKTGIPVAELIRRILDEYLESKESK
jgi:predicted DNA-binding protein